MLEGDGQFLSLIHEGIVMLNSEGQIVYSNPAITKITGFKAAELLHKHICFFYLDQDDLIKADYDLGHVREKGSYIFSGWRLKKDNTKFWGELSIAANYDDENHLTGYSCILRDTTKKKNEELELRKNEERLRLMTDAVKDYAIFMLDVNGNIISWNEGAKKLKGYYPSEIIGKHFSTFYTLEDLNIHKPENELKIAIATGKYEEEGWRVRKDGSLFWARVVITALYSEQNKHIGFSKVTADLTDRKTNEEKLRQSEEKYRLLVDQVTDYGIFMMDEKGRVISWNEGAKKINGYSAEEIIGKNFSIFYSEEDIIRDLPKYELGVAKEEGKYEEEGWRIRKNGKRFWASIVITAIYNDKNTLIGYSKVTKDLTERKEKDRELRSSYERYRKLSEELKLTNSELSLVNDELEQFTSIVSHDLQEPIRTIKSFLQLIDLKLAEKEYDKLPLYLHKSINAADRMKELILNLLHYSQLDKNKIEKTRVHVNDIIQQALQNLRSAVDQCHAEIIIKDNVNTVYGDKVQLVQLLQNLLSNALKFTESNNPVITIECIPENEHIKFAVSDNGIGIAKSDLNKVFEIFRRLDTQKEYPGTGIGLAICKKIIDRHNGKIWPESNPGRGTTFYFTLNKEPA